MKCVCNGKLNTNLYTNMQRLYNAGCVIKMVNRHVRGHGPFKGKPVYEYAGVKAVVNSAL